MAKLPNAKLASAALVGLALGIPPAAQAQAYLSDANAMAEFAKNFCERPDLYGMSRTNSGQIGGSLNLPAILNKLASLGFSGSISHSETRWSGMRQQDAAASLADYIRCKQNTLTMLLKEYRPTGTVPLVVATSATSGSAHDRLMAERQQNNANIARLTAHMVKLDQVISENHEMIPQALDIIRTNEKMLAANPGTSEQQAQLRNVMDDIRDKRSKLILITQSLEFSRDDFSATVSQLQQRNQTIAAALGN